MGWKGGWAMGWDGMGLEKGDGARTIEMTKGVLVEREMKEATYVRHENK